MNGITSAIYLPALLKQHRASCEPEGLKIAVHKYIIYTIKYSVLILILSKSYPNSIKNFDLLNQIHDRGKE